MRSLPYFFINLFSGKRGRPPEGEANKTPSAYSSQGLSPDFTKKYGLSKRQTEVTGALLQGKSDKEIAALLDIALNTVQTHLKHIYRKTGVRGRYALMALVGLGNSERKSS
jgi:DNA-binding CsgD family transcriptional regulator